MPHLQSLLLDGRCSIPPRQKDLRIEDSVEDVLVVVMVIEVVGEVAMVVVVVLVVGGEIVVMEVWMRIT